MEENVIESLVNEMKINSFIIKMFDKICNKCEDGDDMNQLNEYERAFYINQILEMEVNNGGFFQFFYNSSGNFANEIINTVSKIKAFEFVEICKKALEFFDGEVPTDIEERRDFLDELDNEEIFDHLDSAFYAFEDNNDLNQLNYNFIQDNIDKFDINF